MAGPIPLEEAWARMFALAQRLPSEMVPCSHAAGRYLSADLVANRTQPARDLSAMDGFAVSGTGPWRVSGEARAGTPFTGSIGPGEAVRISTGAACPPGTGAIVLVEDSEVSGHTMHAPTPDAGRWIRRRGFDFHEGDTLLSAGQPIGPGQIALALAAGHAVVPLTRQPRVTIVECGDELVADPAASGTDRLPASNGAMLAAQVRTVGGKPRCLGPLPDDRSSLAKAIADAKDADVIVTTGGASVGEHDHVRGALEDCGAVLDFWRVAIRPGKPLLVARLGDRIVLGLPGNPASSFVTAYLFLLPLLRAMQGAVQAVPTAIALPLAAPLPEGGTRREFVRARWEGGCVVPMNERDSSALLTLGRAELLIDRPIAAPSAAVGDNVPCFFLH